jgi:conjugal transfer pilus assembly protein TraD
VSLLTALAWTPAAIAGWRRRARLHGRKLAFIAQSAVPGQLRRHHGWLWIGWGFEWTREHTQLAHDLMRAGASRYARRAAGQMGATWLHGLARHERSLQLPLGHLEGHLLVVGTTGAGKTRLFDLLVTQAVLRGEAVVIIDPKGDRDLRRSAERACVLAGATQRFVYFHPAFASESARIDPLRSFRRPTELASRVAALIPGETGNDPFKAFGQMAMSNVVQGLLYLDARPSLVTLRRYLEGGAEHLVERVLTRYFDERVPDWQAAAQPFLKRSRSTPSRAAGLIRYYREYLSDEHASTMVDGLAALYEHERVHFSKMVASLMPILNMLTSADIGPLLSPDVHDADPRPATSMAECIERGQVVYLGLDALSDTMVGSAIGSILVADLAAVAGERYNHRPGSAPVNLFIDEAAEVVNDPFIQLLNKGRGAGLRLTIATQTFADFVARTGSEAKARQVLGNINNLIALRALDDVTQKYVTDSLPKTRIKTIMRTHGSTTHSANPWLYTGNIGERLIEEEVDLFPPALLGELPNLEYIAKVSGGRVLKGRLPILGSPRQDA